MARQIVTFRDLVACARRVGVQVVEAPSSHRGRVGEMGTVLGTTCHWTGTGLSFSPSSDYPDYNVVKEGRAGLNNSLSAYGLGRFRAIYVFSEDLSYHAGTWSYGGTTDGNGHFLGIEAAGAGVWTAWQREVYPRLVASIHLFIDAPASMAPTHAMGAMPRGRKTDFPLTGGWAPSLPGGARTFHDAVAWLMKNPAYINLNYGGGSAPVIEEDDDMALFATKAEFEAAVQKAVLTAKLPVNFTDRDGTDRKGTNVQEALEEVLFTLTNPVGKAGFRKSGPVIGSIFAIQRSVAALIGRPAAAATVDVDEDALAEQLVAALPQGFAEKVADVLSARLQA